MTDMTDHKYISRDFNKLNHGRDSSKTANEWNKLKLYREKKFYL